MRNGNTEDGIETREITIEVDERTARELDKVAWSFGIDRDELLRRSYRTLIERARKTKY